MRVRLPVPFATVLSVLGIGLVDCTATNLFPADAPLDESRADAGGDDATPAFDASVDAASDGMPPDGRDVPLIDANIDGAPDAIADASGIDGCRGTMCSGACVDTQNDPLHCGSCMSICSVPNGAPRCNTGVCAIESCDPLFHVCRGSCVSNLAVETCGSSCYPCPIFSPGETASCNGAACVYTCAAGLHLCSMRCVDDHDVNACGASCVACRPPDHGIATCDGTACGFTCVTGYHPCGAVCASDFDVTACGAACDPCVPPAHAVATCDGTCGSTCAPDYSLEDGACVPSARPIAPLSTSNVTSQRPILRWHLPPGADAAHVSLCRDRAMTSRCVALDVNGTETRPTAALETGAWYWNVYGSTAGARTGPVSATWQFFVGAHDSTINGTWLSTVDVNGDGYADVAMTGPGMFGYVGPTFEVYYGGATGLPSAPSVTLTAPIGVDAFGFGGAVGPAGDVNGDGYGDLVVASRYGAYGRGSVFLYLGGPTGLATTPVSRLIHGNMYDGFGFAVSGVGDVDGDGYGDVAVLAGGERRVSVYSGGPAGLAPVAAVVIFPATTFAPVGDVDADGYADLATLEEPYPMPRYAAIHLGGPGGLNAVADETIVSPAGSSGESIGTISEAGDVDGDGYTDLLLGASDSFGSGHVYVFQGGAAGLSTSPSPILNPPPSWPRPFGAVMASAHDVDGDGYSDVIVAIPVDSAYGAAAVYRGDPGGLSSAPCVIIAGGGGFGVVAAGGGDVDGDGHADVVVGLPLSLYRGAIGCVESTPVASFGVRYEPIGGPGLAL